MSAPPGNRLVTKRRVLLLRHGRTMWNAQHRFQGQADPPLDDLGRAQAYEVAALVAALKPDLILSSDAKRALQTAAPLGAITGLPVTSEPRFRERSLGHWEGLTRDDVAERYPDEFDDWMHGRDVSRRGGESREQVAERDRDGDVRGAARPLAAHAGAQRAGQLPLVGVTARFAMGAARAQRRGARSGHPAAGPRGGAGRRRGLAGPEVDTD